MSASRQRIRELFEAVVELDAAERSAYLDEHCIGADGQPDAELRRAVDELLAHDAAAPAEFVEPPPPRSTDPIGMRLGDFEVVAELGRGGMGVVYRARQPSLQRDVAVKVLIERAGTTRAEIERFHREARAAAKLDHPHIAKVLADGRLRDVHWFAMELVAGPSLDVELERSRGVHPPNARPPLLPPAGKGRTAAIAALVADVAEALAHAHGEGVVHRDIKPSNLLLTPTGVVKIVDFGIARDQAFGTLTSSHEVIGSLPYMSPEQARLLDLRVDHRTDVYSLGVVLYELLTLERPFGGRTSAEIITSIQQHAPKPLRRVMPSVPADLATICGKAMSKRPERRYSTARELADDLRRFLRHEPITARPPSTIQRVRDAVGRRRVVWSTAAAALIALGTGVGIAAALHPDRSGSTFTRIDAHDRAGHPLMGAVRYLPLDPTSGQPQADAAIELGDLPVETWVPQGFARLVLEVGEGAVGEYARDFQPGGELDLHARLGAPIDAEMVDDEMVVIPAGVIGFDDWPHDLNPLDRRRVEVDSFAIDRHEVSNADYRRFLAAQGDDYPRPPYWDRITAGSEHDRLPVVYVSWENARDYAEWVGKRLPTLAEFSLAARSDGRGRRFPWTRKLRGEPWLGEEGDWRGVVDGTPLPAMDEAAKIEAYLAAARPVDVDTDPPAASYPEGVLHLLGNVWEWTETLGTDPDGPAQRIARHDSRFCAGAAWSARAEGIDLRFVWKREIGAANRSFELGFRCARTISS